MRTLYEVMEFLLPFSFMSSMFMKNALLGVLLVSPLLALLGTMTVNNRMSFFADALGHSALTGIALGVLLGLGNPLVSMVVFSVFLAVAVLLVKRAGTASTDTIIGVFSSSAVALGVVILSRSGGFNKYAVYLIGDLLSIRPADLLMLLVVVAVVAGLWVLVFNRLLLVSLHPSLARSRGVDVKFYEYLFGILLAVVVAVSIQWVGILIISSLLVLPAAAARNVAGNMRQYHLWAMGIALFSGVAGLFLSYFLGTASGATIVLVAAACYFATFGANRIRR
ncbi:metal ABC transporter permease [Anaerotalea alkaliphila]|uniref:Metal ABC transporter permease n=1 Tax=Anaerotalea alkaliphila TaxID=2662126 RepID=A0A7X5HTM4_9FIRM|nr:metal ABC transporter permease [Anaerotalea alkaliphila]NDL66450.1 metal ABC transporter permease [Anaerotalea alkaliphila]